MKPVFIQVKLMRVLTDRVLIRLSTGAPPTPPPSPAVRDHRNAVRLALESVSASHRIPQRVSVGGHCGSFQRLFAS